MKYYIDKETGDVYAFDADGSQDAYIRENLKPLNAAELEKVRAKQAAAHEPTNQQLEQTARYTRDQLLSVAAVRIAPLQYAVDLDDATLEEAELLKKWKQYSIDVNRASDQPKYPNTINWPTPPGE